MRTQCCRKAVAAQHGRLVDAIDEADRYLTAAVSFERQERATDAAAPIAFAPRLRVLANTVDPEMQLTAVQRLNGVPDRGATLTWTMTYVAGVISLPALLLSASGIHALMSFLVARRTRESGIRVALGSPPLRIVSGIFMRASLQVALGILIGSLLVALRIDFGTPAQVLMLVGAATTMLIAALVAWALPLRRALRIDPTVALRAEACLRSTLRSASLSPRQSLP